MRVLMCSMMALVAAATTIYAQDTNAGRADGAKLVKVTGCLSGGPSKFVLTNAAIGQAPGTTGEQATGTSGIVSSYELTLRDGVSLAPHVGRRVELTGVVGEILKEAEDDAPAQGVRPRGPRGLTAQFAVTSVRMISPICLE